MLVKKLFLYGGIAIALCIISYNLHSYVLRVTEASTSYNLFTVYIFLAVVSVLLVISFEFLASLTKHYRDQLGFVYLGSMAVKIMLFCIIFRDVIFSQAVLTKTDSISLLVPIFIFLLYEVIFIVKILNRNSSF